MKVLLKYRSQRGAVVVEFALVALMLFMIIVAMAEFSRAWMLLGVANGAARVGARYAAIVPDVESRVDEVTDKVREALQASRVPDEDIEVEVTFDGSPSQGTPVTVSVIIAFHTSFGNLLPQLNDLRLRAACTMRREI
jgi:Flp pilus assembly protein TadG